MSQNTELVRIARHQYQVGTCTIQRTRGGRWTVANAAGDLVSRGHHALSLAIAQAQSLQA